MAKLRADEIGCLGVLSFGAWFVATFFWMLCFWELLEGSSTFGRVVYFLLAIAPGAFVAGIVAQGPSRRRYLNAAAVFAGIEGAAAVIAYGLVLLLIASDFGR